MAKMPSRYHHISVHCIKRLLVNILNILNNYECIDCVAYDLCVYIMLAYSYVYELYVFFVTLKKLKKILKKASKLNDFNI